MITKATNKIKCVTALNDIIEFIRKLCWKICKAGKPTSDHLLKFRLQDRSKLVPERKQLPFFFILTMLYLHIQTNMHNKLELTINPQQAYIMYSFVHFPIQDKISCQVLQSLAQQFTSSVIADTVCTNCSTPQNKLISQKLVH